jgi:hypothetical protein
MCGIIWQMCSRKSKDIHYPNHLWGCVIFRQWYRSYHHYSPQNYWGFYCFHRQMLLGIKTRRSGNWIWFRPKVKRGRRHLLNLASWKELTSVTGPRNSVCYTPLWEPYKIHHYMVTTFSFQHIVTCFLITWLITRGMLVYHWVLFGLSLAEQQLFNLQNYNKQTGVLSPCSRLELSL